MARRECFIDQSRWKFGVVAQMGQCGVVALRFLPATLKIGVTRAQLMNRCA